MVKIVYKNRVATFSIFNVILYVIAICGFVFLMTIGLPSFNTNSIPPIHYDPNIAEIYWLHINLIILWLSCIIGLIPSFSALDRKPTPTEQLPVLDQDQELNLDENFYIGRSDSMDRYTHYLRSGISIILGISTAIIIWLLNLSPLDIFEEALFFGATALAIFSVLSLLLSFGDTSVSAFGSTLENDLIPHSQTKSQYIAQLRQMLMNKCRINTQMKKIFGIGLLLFIVTPIIQIFQPLLSSISVTPSAPIVSFASFISSFLMFALIILLGILAVGNLGIHLLEEEEKP